MARSRGFVPNFDRLGLRITPSNVVAPGLSPEDCYQSLLPNDSDLPGSDSSISETITWVPTGHSTVQGPDKVETTLISVNWMLPV